MGKFLILHNFCGERATKRLNALGLIPGTEIEVKQESNFKGPIICTVKGSNIVIGYGLAQNVEVEEI